MVYESSYITNNYKNERVLLLFCDFLDNLIFEYVLNYIEYDKNLKFEFIKKTSNILFMQTSICGIDYQNIENELTKNIIIPLNCLYFFKEHLQLILVQSV